MKKQAKNSNDLLNGVVTEDLLAFLRDIAHAKIPCPLLDLAVVEASLCSNELNIFFGEEAGGDAGQHGPLDEGDVGVLKAWHRLLGFELDFNAL